MSPDQRSPIRLAIVNDYEIVVAGVAAMLTPYSERVTIVELDAGLAVSSDVDLILYDTFGQVQGDGVDLEGLLHGNDARLVVFSWNVQRDLVQRALDHGAAGYLSKGMSAEEVVQALEDVADGKIVVPADRRLDNQSGLWPGRDHGLTEREAEVLALITQGLSNQEIAERTYLSINSVKTYIRTAYRKIGVMRRSQAVVWGMQNGFEPDRTRVVESAGD